MPIGLSHIGLARMGLAHGPDSWGLPMGWAHLLCPWAFALYDLALRFSGLCSNFLVYNALTSVVVSNNTDILCACVYIYIHICHFVSLLRYIYVGAHIYIYISIYIYMYMYIYKYIGRYSLLVFPIMQSAGSFIASS